VALDDRACFATVLQFAEGMTLFELLDRRSCVPAPLLEEYGYTLGALSKRLRSLPPPASERAAGEWDLVAALGHRPQLAAVEDEAIRALCGRAFDDFERHVLHHPSMGAPGAVITPASSSEGLQRSWIHGDANDFNVIVTRSVGGDRVSGLTLPGREAADAAGDGVGSTSNVEWHEGLPSSLRIVDWDDLAYSWRVNEPAIALTYLLMDRADPVATAAGFLRHYCEVAPLNRTEARLLLPLVRTRLAVSLCQSASSAAAAQAAGDAARAQYILVHARPASRLLRFLMASPGAREMSAAGHGGAGADFATVHTAPHDEEDAVQRLLAACGHLCPPRAPQSYVHHPALYAEQRSASEAAVAALDALAMAGGLRAITPAILQPSGVAAGAAKGGDWGRGAVADTSVAFFEAPAGWWQVPPFICDLTGSGRSDAAASAAVDGAHTSSAAAVARSAAAPVLSCAVAGEGSVGGPIALPKAARQPPVSWGCYGENRGIYTSEHFAGSAAERRTVHLGVDLELPAGAPIAAPLSGVVHSWARNSEELDYGPTVILRHTLPLPRSAPAADTAASDGVDDAGSTGSVTFFTLYGHLSVSSILTPAGRWRLRPGQAVAAGEVVGWVGGSHVNGGWPPHLHFQINSELNHGGWQGDYPGVCSPADWPVYHVLCPDPNIVLRCPFVKPHGPWGAVARVGVSDSRGVAASQVSGAATSTPGR
jgi:Ser/Thr protein kinase RdoA (MazF antagonist)/murein DD-endopeptidase MepM/ murein hydrolase activator NlpD